MADYKVLGAPRVTASCDLAAGHEVSLAAPADGRSIRFRFTVSSLAGAADTTLTATIRRDDGTLWGTSEWTIATGETAAIVETGAKSGVGQTLRVTLASDQAGDTACAVTAEVLVAAEGGHKYEIDDSVASDSTPGELFTSGKAVCPLVNDSYGSPNAADNGTVVESVIVTGRVAHRGTAFARISTSLIEHPIATETGSLASGDTGAVVVNATKGDAVPGSLGATWRLPGSARVYGPLGNVTAFDRIINVSTLDTAKIVHGQANLARPQDVGADAEVRWLLHRQSNNLDNIRLEVYDDSDGTDGGTIDLSGTDRHDHLVTRSDLSALTGTGVMRQALKTGNVDETGDVLAVLGGGWYDSAATSGVIWCNTLGTGGLNVTDFTRETADGGQYDDDELYEFFRTFYRLGWPINLVPIYLGTNGNAEQNSQANIELLLRRIQSIAQAANPDEAVRVAIMSPIPWYGAGLSDQTSVAATRRDNMAAAVRAINDPMRVQLWDTHQAMLDTHGALSTWYTSFLNDNGGGNWLHFANSEAAQDAFGDAIVDAATNATDLTSGFTPADRALLTTAQTDADTAATSSAAVEAKLPAGARNMAGAGDTATNLDLVSGLNASQANQLTEIEDRVTDPDHGNAALAGAIEGVPDATGITNAVLAADRNLAAHAYAVGDDLVVRLQVTIGGGLVTVTTADLEVQAADGTTLSDQDGVVVGSDQTVTVAGLADRLSERLWLIVSASTAGGTVGAYIAYDPSAERSQTIITNVGDLGSGYLPLVVLERSGDDTDVRVSVVKSGVTQNLERVDLTVAYGSLPSGVFPAPQTVATSPAQTTQTVTVTNVDLTSESQVAFWGTARIDGVDQPIAGQIVQGSASSGSSVTAELVGDNYTFRFDPYKSLTRATKTIGPLAAGSAYVLSFDIEEAANAEAALTGTPSISASHSDITISETKLHTSLRRVNCLATIAPSATTATRTLTLNINTTDGYDLKLTGDVSVDAS